MKIIEWENETRRVAQALHLDKDQAQELLFWTFDMVYDQLEKAQDHFSGQAYPGLEDAFQRLESHLCDAWGLDALEAVA